MSIEFTNDVIHLTGAAGLEDAEELAVLLRGGVGTVDLSSAGTLHTAVVQALLAFRPALLGRPCDEFAVTWLLPLLREASGVEQT